MEALQRTLTVGFGGFLGAVLRYWLSIWWPTRAEATFPWTTLLVNVSGALLIGVLYGCIERFGWNSSWRLFAGIGILGGYTTYSTFAYEAVSLFQRRAFLQGFLYLEASAVLTVGAAALGLMLVGSARVA